ncbi:MAG: sulfatase [Planctomycetota bacterium]|nr:sulfatase [Planctomycetota bacterium]
MFRPRLLLASLGLGAALGLLACGSDSVEEASSEGPQRRPDVLLLLIDTLRADRLGCYGYERDTTPVLDALAGEGVVFRRASAQAPWTIPSVASMMTGRYLTNHQERPSPEAPTLAEVFQGAGYFTLGAVANFVILPDVGFERGFDTFVCRTYEENGQRKKRIDGEFDDAVAWVRADLAAHAAQEERPPLFFYLHVVDPHDSYLRHPQFSDVLPMDGAPQIEPEGWMAQTLAAVGRPAPEDDPGWQEALRRIHRERTCYDREVRYVDQQLGVLLDELEVLGLREDLIVAVVSDHGEELWEHLTPRPAQARQHEGPEKLFFQTHGYLLSEQALRTPFVLHGRGVPAGKLLDLPAENVDLFPTLLELCDLGIDFTTHGESLVPYFEGGAPDREQTFAYLQLGVATPVSGAPFAGMVREEATGLKLVLPSEQIMQLGFEPALFDLKVDPLERHNLFAVEERRDDVARLSQAVFEYMAAYPSAGATVEGDAQQHLREMLQEIGYAGDLIGEDDDGSPASEGGPSK